jgi:serine/threonine protein kinase/tetratricopeptide (TPR) repeat protein
MPGHAADRNLLFGILAFQMDLITRDSLIAAMGAWALAKHRSLGEILVEAGALDPTDRAALEPMIDRRIVREGSDPARSLATLSSPTGLVEELRRSIADPDVLDSLAYVTRYSPTDSLATRPPNSTDPHTVGVRYRKVRDHAEGGLGVVYVARDEELNREVALKEIKAKYADNPASQARFLLEAEITGGLEHPGIVPVYGLGAYEDGRPFYAMRFIRGDSLKDAIAAFHADGGLKADPGARSLALQKLLRRFLDVCNAVAYAHSRGVLHRDLKPDNVMVGKYGETLVVDWGMAKAGSRPDCDLDTTLPETTLNPASASGSNETLPGSVIGTPAYMSPEQAEGRVDLLGPASDVYSLGATLYALLTGVPPFGGGKPVTEVLADVRAGRFTRPRDLARWLDPALEAICLNAMALRPDDRYASPRALAGDIESWLADEPVSAWREPLARRLHRWARRHRVAIQAASALVVVSAALGFAAVSVHRSNRINDIRRAITAGMQIEDWSPAHLEAMEAQGRELARLDPVDGAEVRHQIHQRYATRLLETIKSPEALFPADVARLEGELRVLEARAPDLVARLRENLALRLSRWSPLFDLTTPSRPDVLAKVFPPDRARLAGNGQIDRASPGDPIVKTSVSGSGRVRLTGTFAESWELAPAVGLIQDFGAKGRYLFLVAARELTPKDLDSPEQIPSIGSIRFKGGVLTVQILRDRSIIARSTIPIPVGPLRLEAEHDGEILSLQVNGQSPLVLEDPFPIVAESGVLGVYWPAGIPLNRLTADRRTVPTQPSTMEQGDELFRKGQFAEAQDFYRDQARTQPEGEAGQQACYKQALCLIEIGKPDEAAALLREVAESLEAASTQGRTAPKWSLRAACRLWLQEVQRDRINEADELLTRLAPFYRFEQLVTLIPASDRQAILDVYRASGAWWRVLWLTDAGDLQRLRKAISAQRLLDDDPRELRMTRWRVVDVKRALGSVEVASEALLELLEEPDLSPDERVAFARDHAWISINQGEAATRKALRDVDGWLARPPQTPDLAPLLLERSRLHAALGNWFEATEACEEFFKTATLEKLDYAIFADACLLRGFLLEHRGDRPGALEAWKAGLLRIRPRGLLSAPRGRLLTGIAMRNRTDAVTYSSMLASLTGEINDDEVSAMLEGMSTGTGLEKLEGTKTPGSIVSFVTNLVFSPAYLRSIVLGEFADDRSRRFARAIVFDQVGFLEKVIDPMKHVVASAIRLNEPVQPVPPEVDDLIWKFSVGLVEAYRHQTLKDPQIRTILPLWLGMTPFLAVNQTNQLVPLLPEELRDMGVYVIARRYASLKKPAVATLLFQLLLDRTKPDSTLHELAKSELAPKKP